MLKLTILLGALYLAACAGGPKTPPTDLGVVQVEGGKLIAGRELALATWHVEIPRAIVLALHGFGDYAASTYAQAGSFWASRGVMTYAYDQRGHGRNPDHRDWPGADTLIGDAKAIIRAIRRAHPDTPLYLLGHSMGGGVALAAAPTANIDGLILAAPAVWGGDEIGLHFRAVAWAGAVLFPDKRWTGEGIVTIQASDNIPVLRQMGRDPLIIGAPSSREFLGLIRIMDQAVNAAPVVTSPVLLLYGDKDQVTPPEPVEAAFAAITAPKTLRRYTDGWHLLFRDLQAERVWTDVADWIEEQE